jgi:predicted XRE-type DNA-binding protein
MGSPIPGDSKTAIGWQMARKIMDSIKQIIDQKDLSRAELAMSARMSRAIAGQIHRGNSDKIVTDRLLRIARRVGLKAKITFASDS